MPRKNIIVIDDEHKETANITPDVTGTLNGAGLNQVLADPATVVPAPFEENRDLPYEPNYDVPRDLLANFKKIIAVKEIDEDEDGVGNACDNCPSLKNADQRDRDSNGRGDVCTDTDGDGIVDPFDNCDIYANEDQKDRDEDGIGDPCDDDDGDRVENARDNCPFDHNPQQMDEDIDGVGNVCDKTDDRWSEQYPWVMWIGMASIVIVLAGMGALILKKTQPS